MLLPDRELPELISCPAGFDWAVLEARSVRDTSFVPAEKLTAEPEFEEAETVVLVRVFEEE
jgi:hypothetical protein